ncbi:MAG TPA: ATP-binding protein [Alphaproteobacteria bacterium]|nr:ATP-binding protein [Alphaproteobacteria bacterium]
MPQPNGPALTRARRVSRLGVGFAILLILDLTAVWAAVDVIDSTRAFSVGAAYYAKAQKIAVVNLNRFVSSHGDSDFAEFEQNIGVPLGDRDARVALQTTPFDRAAAEAGLLRGRNPPTDIAKLIRRFRTLGWWVPFRTAVADWAEADRDVEALARLGSEIKAHPADDPAAQAAQLVAIREIDERLTAQEDKFLASMNAAAGKAKAVVLTVLILTTVMLWVFGMLFAARLFHRQVALDRRLTSSEGRFRDYAEVASDWYWEVDGDRKITFLSELFYTLTGATPDDLLGKDATEFLRAHAADAESLEHLEPFMAQQAIRGMRLRYRRPGGSTIYLSVSAKPHCEDDGRFAGYRGVGSDITAAVEAAQNLRAEKERAEIANRAKSEFLANMSHELRTPLNAIIGFSEIIMNRALGDGVPEKYDAYAADINVSGRHLLSLINEILDLSKIEAGHNEIRESEIGLDILVESARHLFTTQFEKGNLALVVDLPIPAPTLMVDGGKLKQCLANLLSNASKFTPAGGTVTVTARFEASGGLAIAVRDTGIGIAKRDIPTVLSPFGQVESAFHRSHTGTGLGLPITKALIEQHGGTLSIESTLGVGTTVTLTLPHARVASQPADEAAAG